MTRIYLVGGTIAIAIYLLSPTTPVYFAIGASCVAAILVGVRVNKPVKTLPWYLMAAGQAAWVAGDLFYDLPDLVRTNPAASDLAYLSAYPLLAAGLAVLVHSRRPERDPAGLIDSAIVTLGVGLLAWVFVADPIVDDSGTPWLERAIAAAYPAGDIILLALVVRLVAAPGTRSPAFRLLVAAIVPLIVADTLFATETTDYWVVLDVLWLGSYVLWGAAALHPTMTQLSSPTATDGALHRPPTRGARRGDADRACPRGRQPDQRAARRHLDRRPRRERPVTAGGGAHGVQHRGDPLHGAAARPAALRPVPRGLPRRPHRDVQQPLHPTADRRGAAPRSARRHARSASWSSTWTTSTRSTTGSATGSATWSCGRRPATARASCATSMPWVAWVATSSWS